MESFDEKYEYAKPHTSARHTWSVVGARMGIHLHIEDYGEEHEQKYGRRYSSGLECHYRTAPDYMRDQAPSQKECWLIGGPCWHDGTSFYAEEHWVPMWQDAPHDHERMLRVLREELKDRDGGYAESGEDTPCDSAPTT